MEPHDEPAKQDMTPMIDVVFLLIIFFLCIDFKVLESKLPAYLPKDRGSQTDEVLPVEQLPVQVIVAKAGTKRPRNPWGETTWRDPRTGATREAPYQLAGHQVRWRVGPRDIDSEQDLLAQLTRVYADRATWQPDALRPGTKKPMPIVIEPQVGACYVDVAQTVDIVTAAGFDEINFGGGMNPSGR